MSTIISRRLVAVGITAAAVAFTGAPAAHASKKSERKQNTAIKKVAASAKKISKNANAAKAAAAAAASAANVASTSAGAADAKGTSAGAAVAALSTKVDGIVATATSALTQLANGLTTAGAGLQKLADFTAADEYGIVQLSFGTGNNGLGTAIPGCFYETGNIPDNVQSANVTGTCIVPSSGATSPATGDPLHFLTAIRSNEVDGVAGGNAAGVAGVVSYIQQANNAQTGVVSFAGAGATTASLGAAGDPPAGVPAVTIPLKSAPTSTTETGFPFAPISTDNLVDLGTTANRFSAPPVFGAQSATSVRTVTFTIRFTDLTSAADNPKE